MTHLKILLIEDAEPGLSLSLQETQRYQVFTASDGLEAVRKTAELNPDLVLLDLGLLNLNAAAATRQIRALAPHAKLLLLGQESSPELARETSRLGAQGCVHRQTADTDLIPPSKRFERAGVSSAPAWSSPTRKAFNHVSPRSWSLRMMRSSPGTCPALSKAGTPVLSACSDTRRKRRLDSRSQSSFLLACALRRGRS